METYGDRNPILKDLGYTSYKDYLDSPLWESIRNRAYTEHGNICRLCENPATEIHHLSYGKEVLVGNRLGQLVPLCHWCHSKIEVSRAGRKRTLQEAQAAYRKLWKPLKCLKKKTLEGRLSLPGYCKECGSKAKKGSSRCTPCMMGTSRDMVQLTKATIEQGRTVNGGYTKYQLMLLDVPWPPIHGWAKACKDRWFLREVIEKFIADGSAAKSKNRI